MEFKKISSFENQIQTPERSLKKPSLEGVKSFEETLKKIQSEKSTGTPLNEALEPLKFSHHAIERMTNRGISFSPSDIKKLNEAVVKASQKGAKDSLILMNDSALIVSVKNKTIVTVMDKEALKENIFTNIDSTIVL